MFGKDHIFKITKMVTASFTTPAIVTVMALVAEISIYSVNTCS